MELIWNTFDHKILRDTKYFRICHLDIGITFDHKILRDAFPPRHSVGCNILYPLLLKHNITSLDRLISWLFDWSIRCNGWLFDRFYDWSNDIYLEDSPDPNTDVCGNNMHQTKAGEALELLNVQLEIFVILSSANVHIIQWNYPDVQQYLDIQQYASDWSRQSTWTVWCSAGQKLCWVNVQIIQKESKYLTMRK